MFFYHDRVRVVSRTTDGSFPWDGKNFASVKAKLIELFGDDVTVVASDEMWAEDMKATGRVSKEGTEDGQQKTE